MKKIFKKNTFSKNKNVNKNPIWILNFEFWKKEIDQIQQIQQRQRQRPNDHYFFDQKILRCSFSEVKMFTIEFKTKWCKILIHVCLSVCVCMWQHKSNHINISMRNFFFSFLPLANQLFNEKKRKGNSCSNSNISNSFFNFFTELVFIIIIIIIRKII